ncbi:MAG TPA: GntR family transcriptional regulator, partial [Arthrobacter bacterium]|nr:GntR family transcriptional regulator [Arthrobacter sp.]
MAIDKSVYSRLREDILSSAVSPEETLTEMKLTERYGASRT